MRSHSSRLQGLAAAVAVTAAIALAFACPVVASAAACPQGEAYLVGPASVGFDASEFDTVAIEPGTSFVTASVACDLAAGTMSAYSGGLYPDHTWLVARDAFDVTGIAAGTPVAVLVELVADGTMNSPGCGGSGCAAGATGWITSGAQSANASDGGQMFGPASRPLHLAVQLPVTIVAGTPRTIEFKLEVGRAAGGDHNVTIAGAYHLTAPAGVSLVSCHGLAQSPTPAHTASWGTVKAAYR
jgi:hypothetical protein